MHDELEASSQVDLTFSLPQRQNRATVFFRFILVIPQIFVLYFVGIAAFVVLVVGWFAALFTGRLPEGIAGFLRGYLRWSIRVYAYMYLMTDRYPPFSLDASAAFPVDLDVQTGRLNRLAVLFRYFLAIPAGIAAGLLTIGMAVFGIVNWFATLIKGEQPSSFFQAYAAGLRFVARFNGYFYMLTSFYPSEVMGEQASAGGDTTASHEVGAPLQSPTWEPGPSSIGAPGEQATADVVPSESNESQGGTWSLLLSSGARKLVVVFFVLGVVGYVAVPVSVAVLGSSISSHAQAITAQNQAADAYNTLTTAGTTLQTETAQCDQSTSSGTSPLSCLETADAKFAAALDSYAQSLAAIDFPTAVSSQASAAIASATKASGVMKNLSTIGTSAASYNAAATSPLLRSSLTEVDSTFNALNTALMTL